MLDEVGYLRKISKMSLHELRVEWGHLSEEWADIKTIIKALDRKVERGEHTGETIEKLFEYLNEEEIYLTKIGMLDKEITKQYKKLLKGE
jgi:hypothetical protein